MILRKLLFASCILLGIISCSNDDHWTEPNPVPPEPNSTKGLYILNEGKWGDNNASLSYYNYSSGDFINNYFNQVNPEQGGLGDVGNDLQIYGEKMYAVINVSNYVEVMNAKTAKHIKKIQIPNGRYITFDKGYAYVSSYAGPIQSTKQLGYIYKIDTANLAIIDKTIVGYQPEEMTISNNKLYVANSGGYNAPDYENRVSVIDLNSFKEITKIEIPAVSNLSKIKVDKNNTIWVTATGNYFDIAPSLSIINSATDTVIKTLSVTVTDFDFYGSNLYFYGSVYDDNFNPIANYGVIDINTQTLTSSHFIDRGTESQITAPYGIRINPDNGDFFIADAGDYKSPGKVFCFNQNGNLKWERTVGIAPGHFAFLIN